ncbi:MAG: sigma-70 family RNA polymerase sigma factor [Isosphaerales bacterium]
MKKEPTGAGRQLDRLLRLGTVGGMTDPQLLEQFVAGDDESAALAFEAIVERHGPMVLRVCQLVLRDAHAAEDAFQATFLVLARRARSLGSRELLCNWLYGVAARTAHKARTVTARRRARDRAVAYHRSVAIDEPSRDGSREDLEQVLHEEIDRLPRPYRSAVVVCYLEGMSQAQAAGQLKLAESTIRGRLARARKLLGQRLTRRGVTLSAGLLALGTSTNASAVRLPNAIVQATARAALLFVKRGKAMPGAVSATAQSIADGVLSTMWFSLLKSVAVMVMAVGLLAGGASLLARPAVEAQHQDKPSRAEVAPEIAVASLKPAQDTGTKKARPAQRPGQKKSQKQQAVTVHPDLAKLAPSPIARAVTATKDCMILAYLPNQNLGHVDNFALANNDGGVRVLIDWPEIPPDEASAADRRFLVALYSRETTSHLPAGPIHAFEILNKWPELNSWNMKPTYDPEPAATYKFEPGEGWKLFDITSLVRAQAKAGREGHGILLRFLSEDFSGGPNPTWSGYGFVSREGADEWSNRRPMLLVVKASKE